MLTMVRNRSVRSATKSMMALDVDLFVSCVLRCWGEAGVEMVRGNRVAAHFMK